MRKAVLFESRSARKSLERSLIAVQFEVARPAKKAWAVEIQRAKSRYDLMLVDLNMPRASGLLLFAHLKNQREVPVVFAGTRTALKQHEKQLEPMFSRPGVEWVTTPIDETEFRIRVNRATGPAKMLDARNVSELRSDVSGRLDAARIADHMGWTLTELSRSLGRSVQSVHKTPDAPALQRRLEKLERSILLGRRLVSPDPAEFRKWLNTPSPDLGKRRPGEVLLKKPDVVVQWLEDAATGHPA